LAEVAYAKGIYGNSLAYDDIYVSDGVGASNRPFTLALPYSGGWIVVLNLGPSLFSKPGSDKSTLIHELAHAWQSQHHADPSQFMMNCVKSQAAAAAATTASRPMVQVGLEIISPALPYAFGGPASAYAYVPGQPFGNYGGEQIAQQVEDFFFPPRLAAPPHVMSPSAKAKLMSVRSHMIALPPGKSDPENVRGLNSIHFAYKAEPNVVWHDFD
jgi:hypothetical protein